MTGIAKPRTRIGKRIKDNTKSEAELQSLMRRADTPSAISTPSFSGVGGSSNSGTGSSSFLPTSGGTMIGPIAFFPRLITISSGEIDIGETTDNHSSRVIVTPESGSTDDLVTITGAKHAGQLLIIQGIATDTLTLKNSGNIETIDGSDFALSDDDNIMLIFDSTDNKWQQVTTGKTNYGGSGVTESQATVTWTGIHSFNGTSTSINSASILLGDTTSDNISFGGRVATSINPKTDNTYDLGSSSLEWKDIHIDGTGYIDTVQSSVITATSQLSSNGNTFLGDNTSDQIFLTGRIMSHIKLDSGGVIKSYDTQEIGYQVTNGTQTVGLKGSLESPVYGTVTVSKSTLDTQFGNLSGNFGFIDTGSGNITLYFRQADGNWAGASLTRDTAT